MRFANEALTEQEVRCGKGRLVGQSEENKGILDLEEKEVGSV